MDELQNSVVELFRQGYHCSQVMMLFSLDLRQIENPLLVRAMGGLAGGMFRQHNCGTLTGGACVLASYVPRAEGEPEPRLYWDMVRQLVDWFEEAHGSVECKDLVEMKTESIMQTCPAIVAATFEKCLEILQANGIDPYE